jgi:hypothetical protein
MPMTITVTQEVEIARSSSREVWATVSKTLSQQTRQAWWHLPKILAMLGA